MARRIKVGFKEATYFRRYSPSGDTGRQHVTGAVVSVAVGRVLVGHCGAIALLGDCMTFSVKAKGNLCDDCADAIKEARRAD